MNVNVAAATKKPSTKNSEASNKAKRIVTQDEKIQNQLVEKRREQREERERADKLAKLIHKEFNQFDPKYEPLMQEACRLVDRIFATEKWVRAIIEDVKSGKSDNTSISELTSVTEKRISLNETLAKAIEARLELRNKLDIMQDEVSRLDPQIYYRQLLFSCSEELKIPTVQKLDFFLRRHDASRAYVPINSIYIGRNINTLSKNIKIIYSDANKIMPELSPYDAAAWKARLDICKEHEAILNQELCECCQNIWLHDSYARQFWYDDFI